MKKYILAIAAAVASLLASCSTDSVINEPITENNPTALHEVVFTIDGIAPQGGELETRSTSLTDMNLKHLEYWVFKTQDINMALDFNPVLRATVTDYDNPITLNLPQGDYTIVFFATDSDEKIIATPQAYIDILDGNYEMYALNKQFVISSENLVIKDNIVLDRIMGKLEFVIEDLTSLPADVQSITFVGTSYNSTTSTPALLAKMSSLNLLTGDATANLGHPLLPTIPRSDFAKYNKDNPIWVYAHPSGLNNIPSSYTAITDIYIQGCKGDRFYDLNMTTSFADQNSNVIFMRKVGSYANIKANRVTRFTGKIGNFDSLAQDVSFTEYWNNMTVQAD